MCELRARFALRPDVLLSAAGNGCVLPLENLDRFPSGLAPRRRSRGRRQGPGRAVPRAAAAKAATGDQDVMDLTIACRSASSVSCRTGSADEVARRRLVAASYEASGVTSIRPQDIDRRREHTFASSPPSMSALLVRHGGSTLQPAATALAGAGIVRTTTTHKERHGVLSEIEQQIHWKNYTWPKSRAGGVAGRTFSSDWSSSVGSGRRPGSRRSLPVHSL